MAEFESNLADVVLRGVKIFHLPELCKGSVLAGRSRVANPRNLTKTTKTWKIHNTTTTLDIRLILHFLGDLDERFTTI